MSTERFSNLGTDAHQNKVASLQVKFSKDYLGSARAAATPEIASSGWWTFQRPKVAASSADWWVLTLYQFQSRKFDFVVVSPQELLVRYNQITPTTKVIQSYFCVTTAGRCWETRGLGKPEMSEIRSGTYVNNARDFTAYLNNWPFPIQKNGPAI